MADQNVTQTQITELPEWARQPTERLVADAEALRTGRPYVSYADWATQYGLSPDKIAGFQPYQQKAFETLGQMRPNQGTQDAQNIAGIASLGAYNTSYDPYQMGQFTGSAVGQYMNPYLEQAMEPQLREAQRASQMQRQTDQAQAVRSGAFGGSRQAIVEAERQRNLGTQMGDIRARGYQTAFDQAQQQFAREQQLREQSRQYGAGLGMQGYQTALQGAGIMGTLGQQQFGQQKDILGLQKEFGGLEQQQEQNKINALMNEYSAQQKYPYQQMEFQSNIMRGSPMGTVQSMYAPPPNPLSQAAGFGLAGLSMYNMMNTPNYSNYPRT
jgi:hypothetical protein